MVTPFCYSNYRKKCEKSIRRLYGSSRPKYTLYTVFYFVLSIILIEIDIVWAATLSISVSFFSGLTIFYIFFLSKNAVMRLHFSLISPKKSSIESVYLSATSYVVLFYERLDQFIISFFISPILYIFCLTTLNLSIHLCLFSCLSPDLSVCNHVCPLPCLSASLSASLSVCFPVCLLHCLSESLLVCNTV